MPIKIQLNDCNKYYSKDYSNFSHSKVLNRHRWYYFKEGFSPLIVNEAIKQTKLTKNATIVDPFLGSGTVALVARDNNLNCNGYEVNPFFIFLAKTKLSTCSEVIFKKYISEINAGIKKGQLSHLEGYSTFSSVNNSKWLFNTEILRAFEGGWEKTEIVPDEVKNVFRLALIKTAMDNANVSRDGKCLRYKKNWELLNYNKESFMKSFESNCKVIDGDLEEESFLNNKINILKKDSRLLSNEDLPNFDLCITSPPYLNSFDYSDIYRPELFLGKFVTNNIDLSKLRLKTLRSHVQVKWEMPKIDNFGYLYQTVRNEIEQKKAKLWNKKIPMMIQAYFEDMQQILKKLIAKANKGASLWIVVSTSAYAGVEIPVDLILADIGTNLGWNLEEITVTRHLRHSTQNAMKWLSGDAVSKRLRESIIIFRN